MGTEVLSIVVTFVGVVVVVKLFSIKLVKLVCVALSKNTVVEDNDINGFGVDVNAIISDNDGILSLFGTFVCDDCSTVFGVVLLFWLSIIISPLSALGTVDKLVDEVGTVDNSIDGIFVLTVANDDCDISVVGNRSTFVSVSLVIELLSVSI